MLIIYCSLSHHLNRTFTRSLIANVLAAISLLFGIVPEFVWHSSSLTFSFYAYTQDFTEAQITKYAQAVLQIETRRQQAYKDIQQIIGYTPPEIVCHQPNTLRNLPSNAQRIAVNYCTTSKKIVENSGLTVSQFNTITIRVRSDQELERRIQNAMIRIRRQQQ